MSEFAVVTLNVIPDHPRTFKYDVLGQIALLNHRHYCEANGYDFFGEAQIDRSRPVCWSKLPAIQRALQTHEWVLWADSDVLISDMTARLEDLCDRGYNLISQCHEHWWKLIGLENGTERFPLNTGVFLIRSSPWSIAFLEKSYAQTQFVTHAKIWDGIGEQEAMNAVIRANPANRAHIRYVQRLQTSPRLFRGGEFMVHFYGNHTRHHIPSGICASILERWQRAVPAGTLPVDIMRFHWCCIQNKSPLSDYVRGDLHNFLYTGEDILLGQEDDQ